MQYLLLTQLTDKFASQTRYVQEWLQHQDEYLDEFIRADGLGEVDQITTCIHCGENEGHFKCQDCFGQGLYCANCIVSNHAFLPLHRILVSSLSIAVVSIAECIM